MIRVVVKRTVNLNATRIRDQVNRDLSKKIDLYNILFLASTSDNLLLTNILKWIILDLEFEFNTTVGEVRTDGFLAKTLD